MFILDAAQTAGLLPIDMAQGGIAAVCCSGHKSLLGPQGTGVLCLAAGVQPNPLKVGGSGVDSFSRRMPEALPAALEAGTLNTHGLAGLCAACEYLECYGVARIFAESTRLANMLSRASGICPNHCLWRYGSEGPNTVVALNIKNCDSAEVSDELFERFGYSNQSGAHCATVYTDCSHRAAGNGAVQFFAFQHGQRG